MICRVKIVSQEKTLDLSAETGTTLLALIREARFDHYAPCGGNGTCGKCKVIIEGVGTVTSCQYLIEKDITIHLPDKRMMDVLTTQHQVTATVPFMPGKAAAISSYPLGLAIDIGTTTIVYYLVNLITGAQIGVHSEVNPQSRFGADVISRINHCMTNSGGLNELRNLTIQCINRQVTLFAEEAGIGPEFFTGIVIAGNNVMLHILAGADPGPIALAPFTPAFTGHRVFGSGEIGININPEAEVQLLPSVSSYVGADIVAGIASIDSDRMGTYLYIDIGTNGEMALVTKERIWCCSTAAGPAFEGANISCGSGAFDGAISRFNGMELATIADAQPVSICGSGLVDVIAYMVEEGMVDGDGTLVGVVGDRDGSGVRKGRVNEKGFVVSPREENGIDADIVITQKDVREVQLAKGAIAAGISVLLKRSGYDFDRIDQLVIAGGFGNYLDIENAMRIGLLPEAMRGKSIQVGNAAGTGAVLALKSGAFMDRIREVVNRSEYIELSYDEDFPLEFAMKMGF